MRRPPSGLAPRIAALAALTAAIAFVAVRGTRSPAAARPLALAGEAAAPGAPPAAALVFGAPLDLNAATQADLEALPGIGPVRADRILATRAARPNARFDAVDDLLAVSGIGPKTLARLRPLVTVAPPVAPPVSAASSPGTP